MKLSEEIRELAAKATKGNLKSAQYFIEEEIIECPFCNGSGEIEATNYCNFDEKALGVQFYGIGKEFGAHEKLWFKIIDNLPLIISSLEHYES